MIRKQKIMAVGAHADDIEVGTGGTLRKYNDQGYEIVYVMSTNNMSGSNKVIKEDGSIESIDEPPLDMMKLRKKECDDAAALVGTKTIHLDHPQRHYNGADGRRAELRYGCDLPDGVEEDVPAILTAYEDPASIQQVVALILEHNPACILTHGITDTDVEHLTTTLLVTRAFWKSVEEGFRGALLHWQYGFTSLGDINTRWETYVDISDYVDHKMEMLGKHRCQMPTADDPDHGHRLRVKKYGTVCGCQAAEPFNWVRRYDFPDLDAMQEYYSPLITELVQNSM